MNFETTAALRIIITTFIPSCFKWGVISQIPVARQNLNVFKCLKLNWTWIILCQNIIALTTTKILLLHPETYEHIPTKITRLKNVLTRSRTARQKDVCKDRIQQAIFTGIEHTYKCKGIHTTGYWPTLRSTARFVYDHRGQIIGPNTWPS